MHLTPVGTHLFAIFAAGVEVGDLVGSEHVVHILGEFGLKGSHDGELLAHKYLGKQFMCSGEDHGLLLEVFNMGAFGEKLRHIAHMVACLLGESVTGSRKNGGTHEDGYIWEFLDELRHKAQVLSAVVLGGNMDLQEGDVHLTQVVVVTLWRVADEEFALRVVVFQPIFEGSANEATSDNSDVDHFI